MLGGLLSITASCMQKSEKWRDPQTREESVLVIGDSLCNEEQLALRKQIQKYCLTDGIVEVRDGRYCMRCDTALAKSLNISPSYLKLIQEELDSQSVAIKKMNLNLSDSMLNQMLIDARKE